jgi:hypothetical protein
MGNLQPAVPQEEMNVLKPAQDLAKIAKDAPERIELEAIALRLNTMANDGETAWTPKTALKKTTVDKLTSLGYIVIPQAGGLVEIRLPKVQEVSG